MASGFRDYFKVLGVERNANADEIKRSFRKLARKFHPDVNPGDSAAEANFKEVSEAYEVLSDPEKRRKYEQFGKYWTQSNGMAGNKPYGAGFDVDFGSYGNFDDFINDLLGKFGGGPGPAGFSTGFPRNNEYRPQLNLDAEVKLKVSFPEAFHGAERILSVNSERVKVLIPKGIRTGSKLRLKGKGNLQPGTGRRGDLYLKIEVQPHPIWRLDGHKLTANLPVSIDELALGGTVRIMTPDGEADVSIPAFTQSGRSLRLKGKGWPLKEGRGDLILVLTMEFPNEWSDKELEIFEDLRKNRSKNPRKIWLKSARL